MTFLSLFDEKDLAVLKFRFDSYRPWIITTTELSVINSTIQNLGT